MQCPHPYRILAALVFLNAIPHLHAKEKTIDPPLIVKGCRTEVNRDGEVQVRLVAIPNYGNEIHFEIVIPPQHGSVDRMIRLSDHEVRVTYRHHGSKTPLEDSFTYRAKSSGRSPSVPAKVSLAIIPGLPRLKFLPSKLEFGEVPLSEHRFTNVQITNVGGSKASGRLLLRNGWRVSDGDRFALEEGESVMMRIEYSPMQDGSGTAEVDMVPEINHDPLELRASAIPRYSVTPCGETCWMVKNHSTNQIRMNVDECVGWEIPPELTIPPEGTGEIRLNQSESLEGASTDRLPATISTHMVLSDGFTKSRLEIPAQGPLPPLVLRSISPEFLGDYSEGTRLRVSFTLDNRSDSPRNVRWKAVSRSGGGMSVPQFLQLHAGKIKTIDYEWAPSMPGEAMMKVTVEEEGMLRKELVWRARILTHDASLGANAQLFHDTSGSRESESAEPSIMVPDAPSLPAVDDLSWSVNQPFFGKPILTLRWKKESDPISQARLSRMVLIRDEHQETQNEPGKVALPPQPILPKVHLEELPISDARRESSDAGETLTMDAPAPGLHLLTLRLYHADKTYPDAQSQLQVRVPPPPSLWDFWKLPVVLFLIGALITLCWKRPRA